MDATADSGPETKAKTSAGAVMEDFEDTFTTPTTYQFFSKEQEKASVVPGTTDGPLIIVDDARDAANVGAIHRLAVNVGACGLVFAYPDNKPKPNFNKRNLGRKAAQASKFREFKFKFLPYSQVQNVLSATPSSDDTFDEKTSVLGARIVVGVETSKGARNLYQTQLPRMMTLILGNESRGISQALLSLCQIIV